MKDKFILVIILLVAAIAMHFGKHPKVDTSKMTAQEKRIVEFAIGTGM